MKKLTDGLSVMVLTLCVVFIALFAAGAAEKPDAPSFNVANCADGLKASWSAVENAGSYKVYYKPSAASVWSCLETEGTSAVIPDTLSGTVYNVQVRSIAADGSEGGSSAVKSVTFIARAEITDLSFNGASNTLMWDRAGGANKYQIAKIKAGDKAYTYYTTTSLSYTDYRVVAAAKYSYQVRAMYTANGKTVYGAWSKTKSTVTVTRPEITLSNKSNGVRVEWNASVGAAKYIVYFRQSADAEWSSATTKNTYYPFFDVTSGTSYRFQVRPVNGSVNGSFSKVKGITYIGQPSVGLSSADSGVNVSWNSVEGGNRFEIAKKKSGASSYTYYTTGDTSYFDNSVDGNTCYLYQVRALYEAENNSVTYGAWSKTRSIVTLARTELSLSNKSNGIRATWKAVNGASEYIVDFKSSDDAEWSSKSTKNTYYPLLDVESGKLYSFKVRPVSGNAEGPDSRIKSMTFIAQVSAQMSASDDGMRLDWGAVNGANKFQIAKKKRGDAEYEYFTSENAFFDDNAVAGSKDIYTYQVRAMYETPDNGTAFGAWSAVYNLGGGKVLNGYQTTDGKKYYYINGVLQKKRIVGTKAEGYYLADSDGVCCVSEEMRLAAEFVMNCGTGATLDERMKTSYKYLADHFPYSRSFDHPKSKADIPALAVDMFKNEKGNCFRYAACFTCIARVCGYRSRIAVGCTGNGSPHGWAEVLIDGKWYYFDPDMQLPGYGFPDYYAYKMTSHPWHVRTTFKSEVTIDSGKAVWN